CHCLVRGQESLVYPAALVATHGLQPGPGCVLFFVDVLWCSRLGRALWHRLFAYLFRSHADAAVWLADYRTPGVGSPVPEYGFHCGLHGQSLWALAALGGHGGGDCRGGGRSVSGSAVQGRGLEFECAGRDGISCRLVRRSGLVCGHFDGLVLHSVWNATG